MDINCRAGGSYFGLVQKILKTDVFKTPSASFSGHMNEEIIGAEAGGPAGPLPLPCYETVILLAVVCS